MNRLSSADETSPATATAEVDALRTPALDQLRGELGEALIADHLAPGDDLWIRVRTADWRSSGQTLQRLGYEYFCFLSAIDWLPSPYGKGEDDPTEPPPEPDKKAAAEVKPEAPAKPEVPTGPQPPSAKRVEVGQYVYADDRPGVLLRAAGDGKAAWQRLAPEESGLTASGPHGAEVLRVLRNYAG